MSSAIQATIQPDQPMIVCCGAQYIHVKWDKKKYLWVVDANKAIEITRQNTDKYPYPT